MWRLPAKTAEVRSLGSAVGSAVTGGILGSNLKIQEYVGGTGQLLKVGANRPSHFRLPPHKETSSHSACGASLERSPQNISLENCKGRPLESQTPENEDQCGGSLPRRQEQTLSQEGHRLAAFPDYDCGNRANTEQERTPIRYGAPDANRTIFRA
jgi:hypothetical protein